MNKNGMKAYKDVDEWLATWREIDKNMGPNEAEEVWAREAWKQAMRSARVQEIILLGEMKKLREELQEMEQKWNTSWNEDNE